MDNIAKEQSAPRKFFVRVCYVIAVTALVALAAWGIATWRWWRAITYIRMNRARVERHYVGPEWVPETCRVLPCLFETAMIQSWFYEYSDSDIQYLNRIGEVRALRLSLANLSDDQIISLSHLRGVRVCEIAVNKITDVGVTYLSRMSSIQEINLDENPVTNASLQSLRALPHLKELSVVKTSITSEAANEFARDTGVKVIFKR